jgi:hypothetical protein
MPFCYFLGGVTVSLIAIAARGGVTVSRLTKLLRGGVTVSLLTSVDNELRLLAGGVTVSLLIEVLKLFVVGLTLLFLVQANIETAIDDATKPIVNSFFILINFNIDDHHKYSKR